MQALWDSIVLGAQESWDSLVSSVSGIGQRISDKLAEMWAGVTEFFSKIDLFESGAKLLDTFTEGIKSKISSLVGTVENALAKVREYLPFSDAHTGPLSQLTLSGTRMMTTLGEGVGQGAPGLVGSVSGVLGRAGAAIGSWWAGLTGAEQKVTVGVPGAQAAPAQAAAPVQTAPQAPDASVLAAPLPADLDVMCAGVLEAFQGLDLSESGMKLMGTFADGIRSAADLPASAVEAALARVREYLPFSDAHTGPLSQLTLSGTRMMSTLGEGVGQGAPVLEGSVSGALGKAGAAIGDWWVGLTGAEQKVTADVPGAPTAPGTSAVNTAFPQVQVPADPLRVGFSALPEPPKTPELSYRMPDMPNSDLGMPRTPEIPNPSLKLSAPDSPDIAVDERQSLSAREGRQSERPAQQSWTVTIQNLYLPSVEKAEDFATALKSDMAQYGEA